MKTKIFIALIYFTSTFNFYSQSDVKEFDKSIRMLCQVSNHPKLFHNSIDYFFNNNVDSTYINISKYLLQTEENTLFDYAHYLQGACAIKKKLWGQAKESMSKISDTFDYNYLKKLKLGVICLHQKKYKEALSFYEQWESTYGKEKSNIHLKQIYHNIGICHLHLKNHKKAAHYLYKERNLAIQDKDTISIIYATMDIANLFYEQYMDDKAIPLFKEAYILSKSISNIEIKQNAALNMSVVEENRNKLKASIAYRKEYEKWKDSIWNRDKIWELSKQEKAFAVAQKEKEIELQEKQIEVQKTRQSFLYAGIISLLVFIGIIGLFLKQRIHKNKIITAQKNKLQHLNEMKNKLFSIVSHDLRTPINSIRHNNTLVIEAVENSNQTELIAKINEGVQITNGVHLLLDKVLNWSLLESGQLFTNLESFMLKPIISQIIYDYESILNSKKIQLKNNIPAQTIVYSDIESTKVVLRNLLDNAIKYSHNNGSIIFDITHNNDNFVHLQIIDSGIGISKEKLKNIALDNDSKNTNQNSISGFGLRLCKSLLRNNGGDLTIKSKKNVGTTVEIVFLTKNIAHK